MREFLISGTNSGLGKALHERFGGLKWNRDTTADKIHTRRFGTGIIIHCAINSGRPTLENLNQYVDDNYGTTKLLLHHVPRDKFIFISTVDVYPKVLGRTSLEDDLISPDQVSGIYPMTKIMSEAAVREESKNHLILRCSALLGKYSRRNSLIKILDGENPGNLSGESSFNYVLHSDIADFIATSIDQDLTGTFNIVSSRNITLEKVAKLAKKEIKFGSYIYNSGQVDNSKVVSVFPAFNKTSEEVVEEFIQQRSSNN